MDETRICWVCRAEFAGPFPEQGDTILVDCCNCGDYKISASLRASQFPLPDTQRYRFSFWCKQQQLEKREPPLLNSYSIDTIVAGLPSPTVHEKPDILLRSFSLLYPEAGKIFKIDTFRQWSLAGAVDLNELNFHVNTLLERGDLKRRAGPDYEITGTGWARIGENLRLASYGPKNVTDNVSRAETHVTSHGQVGGITANTVTVNPPPPPPPSEPPKQDQRWWERGWVIAGSIAAIIGTIIAILTYTESHHAKDDKVGNNTYVTSNNQSGGITAGTVNIGPQPRKMDDQFGARLAPAIPKNVKVNVSAAFGDEEAFGFATEVTAWLRANGWEHVEGTGRAVYSKPILGIEVDTSNPNLIEVRVGRHQ
jgi:hypothetical protein